MQVFYSICQSTVFTASVWFQVLVTAERYVAVCKPLHASEILTTARIRGCVAVVWVCSFLISVPRMFDKSVFSAFKGTSVITNDLIGWEVTISSIYQYVYALALRLTIDWILPFVLLTYFTVRALHTLKERYNDQLGVTNMAVEKKLQITKEQRRTTAALTLILVLFVVTQLPVKFVPTCAWLAPQTKFPFTIR